MPSRPCNGGLTGPLAWGFYGAVHHIAIHHIVHVMGLSITSIAHRQRPKAEPFSLGLFIP